MGWSCSDSAYKTMQALEAFSAANGYDGSNMVSPSSFFECDRVEHDDGAITGEVVSNEGLPMGAARIAPDGTVAAMPTLDLEAFSKWRGEQKNERFKSPRKP